MTTNLFSLCCDSINGATFVGFRGKEQIGRPYEFDLFFTLPVGTSVKSAVGQRAMIKADRGDGAQPVVIHGVIAQVSLMHQTAERALYRALLVPRLWLLRHFRRSHVFTFKKVKDFLTATLQDGGLTPDEFRFSIEEGAYPEEEFVAQYRESHLDFFHRWLEREGLYYYFEHGPGAQNEVLVIVDHKGLHDAFPGDGHVRYYPVADEDAGVAVPAGLHHLEADVRWLPKTLTIADYDYAHPSANLSGESPVSPTGVGIIHEYGYRVFAENEAKRLAKVRAEAIVCHETTLRASGDALGPRAGYRLVIDEAPADLDEEWLAIEVEHTGALAGMTKETARLTGLPVGHVYQMKLFAVPSRVQYRTPQTTAWPRVYGFENGLVMGPADSPYAQIDADGRYLVRFDFDTSDLPDAKISTRVRMLQPHGGQTEGFHFPLRKNTEVMVAFLGGDPDRPIIAGVVSNAEKPSVVGQRNHTQNIIRTGSNNQIVMEDEQGQEFIFMHTPNNSTGLYMGHPAGPHGSIYTGEKNALYMFISPDDANPASGTGHAGSIGGKLSLSQRTGGNAGVDITGKMWVNIGGTRDTFVMEAVSDGYHGTYKLQVGGDATEFYYAKRSTEITSGRSDKVKGGGMTQDIHGGLTQTIEPSGSSTVTGGWTHKVTGQNHDDYGSWKAEAKDSILIDCTAGKVTIHSPTEITLDAPKVSNKAVGQWFKMTAATLDLYGSKNSAGIQKFDGCGISIAVNGLKTEATGVAMSATSTKCELVGQSLSIASIKCDNTGIKIENAPEKLTMEAVGICGGAVRLFAKAFLKL